jgi:hypothetical protein
MHAVVDIQEVPEIRVLARKTIELTGAVFRTYCEDQRMRMTLPGLTVPAPLVTPVVGQTAKEPVSQV